MGVNIGEFNKWIILKNKLVTVLIITIMLAGCFDGEEEKLVKGIKKGSPKEGATDVPLTTNILVEFDREVDHFTAEFNFVIIPEPEGNITWDGKTMTFTPSEDLYSGASYTCVVGKNTGDADGNTFLEKDYRWQFETEIV